MFRDRAEGHPESEHVLVLRLLTRRLGAVAPEVQTQVQSLSLAQLESLCEDLLDFSEPDDLLNWLRSHP